MGTTSGRTHFVTGTPHQVCAEPMMTEEYVPVDLISASSSKDDCPCTPENVVLSNEDSETPSAWSPADSDEEPYIEIHFNEIVALTTMIIKGGENGEFVSQFKLEAMYCEICGPKFVTTLEKDEEGNLTPTQKIFEANSDDVTEVSIKLMPPIIASVVRIFPVQSEESTPVSMQVDFKGCAVGPTTGPIIETTKTMPVFTTKTMPVFTTTTPKAGETTTQKTMETTTPKTMETTTSKTGQTTTQGSVETT